MRSPAAAPRTLSGHDGFLAQTKTHLFDTDQTWKNFPDGSDPGQPRLRPRIPGSEATTGRGSPDLDARPEAETGGGPAVSLHFYMTHGSHIAVKVFRHDQDRTIPALKGLDGPMRLRILRARRHDCPLVTKISNATGLAQTPVSFRLRVPRKAGFVRAERHGATIYYCLAGPEPLRILPALKGSLGAHQALPSRSAGQSGRVSPRRKMRIWAHEPPGRPAFRVRTTTVGYSVCDAGFPVRSVRALHDTSHRRGNAEISASRSSNVMPHCLQK